jgi:hypothetical protein
MAFPGSLREENDIRPLVKMIEKHNVQGSGHFARSLL